MLSANLNAPPNFDLLWQQVNTAFGPRLIDLNVSGLALTVSLFDETPADQITLTALAAAHNPAQLTDAQRTANRRAEARQAYQLLTVLRGMSPDQAEAWVQANVTGLASAKAALKLMARLLVILARVGDLDD